MLTVKIIALVFAVLALLSYLNIRGLPGIIRFIYRWAFPVGSFVWEDLFVFSVYGLGASLVTLYSGQVRIGYLFFLVFWVIRSAGETLYFFLQQFIEPKHHPHFLEGFHFKTLKTLFGPLKNQQYYIIMQVFFQIIMMTSTTALILLLLNWENFN